MLQHWKDQMSIRRKGYAKHTKHPLKLHKGYDDKNEKTINPNGNHQ